MRYKFVRERRSAINRIHKLLKDANIKLEAVASDIMGVSGKAILKALSEGITDPTELASYGKRLHSEISEICEAVDGFVHDHHHFQLQTLLDHIRHSDEMIGKYELKVSEKIQLFQCELELHRLIRLANKEQPNA
jgi:hypothetical protein